MGADIFNAQAKPGFACKIQVVAKVSCVLISMIIYLSTYVEGYSG